MSAADEPVVAAAGSRREGRERVLGLLYEAESKGVPLTELVEALPLPLTGYARQVTPDLAAAMDDIDERLEAASHHWSVARMPAIDRALLRMGTFELEHRDDIPAGVIINEAVELAGEYSTDSSSRFVNGVLARLARELRPDEPAPEAPPEP
ncbi:MAG: transcription antitermination factor NusB [Actinomycetota bacterium]